MSESAVVLAERPLGHDERADELEEAFAAAVAEGAGKLVVDDEVLVGIFPDVVAAVEAARVLVDEDRDVRVAVATGPATVARDRVRGEAVRRGRALLRVGRPGAIVASDAVRHAVEGVLPVEFEDVGLEIFERGTCITIYEVRWRSSASPAVPPPPAPAPPTRSLSRRQLVLTAFGVALVVAAGSLALYRLTQSNRTPSSEPVVQLPSADGRINIGVMDLHKQGSVPDWVCPVTREGLNTVLQEFPQLRIYSRAEIDFLMRKRSLDELEVAKALGITKMFGGTITLTSSGILLQVQVTDVDTGIQVAAGEALGTESQLVGMQNKVVFQILRRMRVPIDEAVVQRIDGRRMNEDLQNYRLLAEGMGDVGADEPPPPKKPVPPTSWRISWPAEAFADDSGAEKAAREKAIRELLERYRAALEAEDIGKVSEVYLTVTDGMRDALTRYFSNANDLHVHFSDLDVLIEGDEALATFTRSDDFKERSGRPVHLEVRVSSVIAKQGDDWKIKLLKKPS